MQPSNKRAFSIGALSYIFSARGGNSAADKHRKHGQRCVRHGFLCKDVALGIDES